MYSIWGRFRDIIGEGSGLVDVNPSLLSPRRVERHWHSPLNVY